MIKTDNSAGRLYDILNKFSELSSKTTQGQDVWITHRLAHAFRLPNTDKRLLLQCMFQLHQLVDDIERDLRGLEWINSNLYMQNLRRIKDAYTFINLGVTWQASQSHPTREADLTALAFCAELLSKHNPEKPLSSEELDALLKETEELTRKVINSSLSQELKTLIMSQLEVIRKAILDSRVRGVASLREALSTIAGECVLNEEILADAGNTEEVSSFRSLTSKFASIIAFASNATKLIETAAKYIPMLVSGDPPDVPPVN